MIRSAAEVYEEIIEKINSSEYRAFINRMRNASSRRAQIRAFYEYYAPDIQEASKRGGMGIDVYSFDWEPDWKLSPPEEEMWGFLRQSGMPFYPQYPVLEYLIDFADPHRKIGIEVDGEKYHDVERDVGRDRRLMEMGWKVFRVPAKQCMGGQSMPDFETGDSVAKLRNWMAVKGAGFVYALRRKYYAPYTESQWMQELELEFEENINQVVDKTLETRTLARL